MEVYTSESNCTFALLLFFLKSAMNCGNSTELGIVNAATRDARTDMGTNMAFFRELFDVHFADTLDSTAVK